MQYETALGLRKEHTFDEVRRYIQADADKIQYPKRDALFLQKSHIYGQVKASMRNYGDEARLDQAQYRASEQNAPYVPPKPKPPPRRPRGFPDGRRSHGPRPHGRPDHGRTTAASRQWRECAVVTATERHGSGPCC